MRQVERTPQGGLRVPAAVARTGIQTYQLTDGRTVREYRSPEEVFSADSLATLRGAPVTDLHPETLVTADNWKALSVGHVADTIERENDLVVTQLLVQDAAECRRIDARERVEVSCGYECELDETPGVSPEGEPFDRQQRAIRYNHVGLGPEGWGRAGSRVSLRLDGAAVQIADASVQRAPPTHETTTQREALPPATTSVEASSGVSNEGRSAPATPRLDAAKDNTMTTPLKVRGTEFKLDSDVGVAAAQGAVDEMTKKMDTDAAELAAVKTALMDALTKVASLEAKMTAAAAASAAPAQSVPPMTEADVPESVQDSIAAKRLALRADAAVVLGDDASKIEKAAELKRAVITKVMPDTKLDGLSADTVDGMFRAVVASTRRAKQAATKTDSAEKAEPRNDALANARAQIDAPPTGTDRHDATDTDPRDEMIRQTDAQREAARKGDH